MTATRNLRDTKQLAPPAPFPINADAERDILGAVLLEPSLLATCTDAGLSREHFGLSSHAEIYSVLLRMDAEGKPIDALLLAEEMDVSRIGGMAYLSDMRTGAIAVAAHVRCRCQIVIRNAQLRRILTIADSMDTAARERGASPQDIADRAIQALTDLVGTSK